VSLYRCIKKSYRKLLRERIRHAIWNGVPLPLKRLRGRLIRVLEKTATHDDIYDEDYYSELPEKYRRDAHEVIAETIVNTFHPKFVVDVGCGSGLLLLAMKRRGVRCLGLEYADAAIRKCRGRGVEVLRFDLERDSLPKGIRGDVVTSTEVAEHLPENCAERFVRILCSLGDIIIMTATEPKSTHFGTDHINEQPKEYWIGKFARRGFMYDELVSGIWRSRWEHLAIPWCNYEGLMVFRKTEKRLPPE